MTDRLSDDKKRDINIHIGPVDSAVSESAMTSIIDNKLRWLSSKEAAFYLRISVGHLRTLVQRGELNAYRFKRALRFLRSDLDQLLKPAF